MLTSALYHLGVLINKYGVLALAWDDTQVLSCVEFVGDDDVDNDNAVDSDEKLMVMMMAMVKVMVITVSMVVMMKECLP